MSLAQLHYTSAPGAGPEGPGAHFTSVPPGVPRTLLDEIEQAAAYQPPRDAPPHPSLAELASFPRSFSFTELSDGSRLLARAACTGVDHTGRWCAYHCHAVLVPPESQTHGGLLPGGVLPIGTWASPLWSDRAPEGGADAPQAGSPFPAGDFGPDALVAFALSRSSRLPDFLARVRALCEPPSDGPAPARMLLVERDSTDVARWLALASTALPPANTAHLTFTTYTRQPASAPQRVVGVLPEDARVPGGRRGRGGLGRAQDPAGFEVFDAVGEADGPPAVADTWASLAARAWLGHGPGLFGEADALPGGRGSAGALACAALLRGVPLGPDAPAARAEAARWARDHARELDRELLARLVEALCAPSADDRTADEPAALTELFGALGALVPGRAREALGELVLTLAVRAPTAVPALPVAGLAALPTGLRDRLADELTDEVRAGVAAAGDDVSAAPTLLRAAGVLGVDCTDLLNPVAERLAQDLLAEPGSAWRPEVAAALDEHFELRTRLLSALDTRAADDPVAAARLLADTSLRPSGVQILPHLQMCAGAPWRTEPGEPRLGALHAALRAAGVSPLADPLVLRTAMRLVWQDAVPSAADARRLLDERGSDAHRSTGTWQDLVRAAVEAPPDDPDAPGLAHDLMRRFPEELRPGTRAALRLLDFAGRLADEGTPPPWVERALELYREAEPHGPVAPPVRERVVGTLARRLLSEDRPDGELYALVHCGRRELLDGYGAVGAGEPVSRRARTAPSYAADCFLAWTSLPGATKDWDDTRTALLEKVLRPVVRAAPPERTAEIEGHLRRAGVHHVDEFRAWTRESTLSRLGRRLGALGRRG